MFEIIFILMIIQFVWNHHNFSILMSLGARSFIYCTSYLLRLRFKRTFCFGIQIFFQTSHQVFFFNKECVRWSWQWFFIHFPREPFWPLAKVLSVTIPNCDKRCFRKLIMFVLYACHYVFAIDIQIDFPYNYSSHIPFGTWFG